MTKVGEEWVEFCFHNIKYQFRVNSKVFVRDDISHTYYLFPRCMWIKCKEYSTCSVIDLFYCFTNGLDTHASRVE